MNILKPKVYNGFDPTGWWMAEKFDGVRAEWDGEGSFLSKADKTYHVPKTLCERMPKIPLSGEWWLGRGMFQKTVSIVRNQRMDIREWENLKFLVFEMPTIGPLTFEQRHAYLEQEEPNFPPFVHVILWTICESRDDFDACFQRILDNGGEGMVLAQQGSFYEFKRSSTQWKKTPVFTAEATVTGHTAGTGKHEGKVGALEVVAMPFDPDNRCILKFKVGTGLSDVQRSDPPPVGSVITYSYKGLTNAGVPRHPAFIEVRDYE